MASGVDFKSLFELFLSILLNQNWFDFLAPGFGSCTADEGDFSLYYGGLVFAPHDGGDLLDLVVVSQIEYAHLYLRAVQLGVRVQHFLRFVLVFTDWVLSLNEFRDGAGLGSLCLTLLLHPLDGITSRSGRESGTGDKSRILFKSLGSGIASGKLEQVARLAGIHAPLVERCLLSLDGQDGIADALSHHSIAQVQLSLPLRCQIEWRRAIEEAGVPR